MYSPQCFNSFQGFSVQDIKERRSQEHMEIVLGSNEGRTHLYSRCGATLGAKKHRYWVKARSVWAFGEKSVIALNVEKLAGNESTFYGNLNSKYALQWLYQKETTHKKKKEVIDRDHSKLSGFSVDNSELPSWQMRASRPHAPGKV